MKRAVAVLLVLAACFFQITLTAYASYMVPAANLTLVAIVLASCFLEGSDSLWLAFMAGAILDFFSLSEFGFNMAFLVIIALITKLLINIGRSSSRLSFAIIVVSLGTVFYNLLLIINLLLRDDIISYLLLSRQIAIEVILNMTVFLLAYGAISYITGRKGAHTTKLTFALKKK